MTLFEFIVEPTHYSVYSTMGGPTIRTGGRYPPPYKGEGDMRGQRK